MPIVYRYLHALFAFVYVGSLFATHWNVLAARRALEWRERETLLVQNRKVSAMFGLPSLIALGVLGHLLGVQLGYRMSASPMFVAANLLWAVALVIALAVDLPATGALAALAHAAAHAVPAAEPAGWQRELGRWRAANGVQLLLFLVLLALMVAPSR